MRTQHTGRSWPYRLLRRLWSSVSIRASQTSSTPAAIVARAHPSTATERSASQSPWIWSRWQVGPSWCDRVRSWPSAQVADQQPAERNRVRGSLLQVSPLLGAVDPARSRTAAHVTRCSRIPAFGSGRSTRADTTGPRRLPSPARTTLGQTVTHLSDLPPRGSVALTRWYSCLRGHSQAR